MGLETVKEDILGSAKDKADAIINEARKEAVRMLEEARKKTEQMKEKSEIEAKKMMDTIKRQEIAAAELENKKTVMEAKKQVLQKLFDQVKEKIAGMDDRKRELYLKKLLDMTKNEFEIAAVYCNKKDAKFFKGFNVQNIDVIGGFIAENREGTIRIDNTFETYLDSIKESEMQEISKTLFG